MKILLAAMLLASVVLGSGCNEIDRDLLVNSWKGSAILLDKKPSGLTASEVRLELRSDESFSYTDIAGNSQNGRFRTNKMGMLYLNPTDGFEKAWQVMKLTSDSLVLKMESGSKDFELFLISDGTR